MDQHFWPKERADLVLFGDCEVGMLAKLVGESAPDAVSEFRDWKLQGHHQGETMKRLVIASNTFLLTSAECERGFSACNDTNDQTRNRLHATSLNALLFVDLNGPPYRNLIQCHTYSHGLRENIGRQHRGSLDLDHNLL
ncbi:uncharacterized protein LOC117440336 [Scomber scombrus]|uniref:Uncharacterized protein LOC117440336 n=1 Tax=Scomber scombrus TaxID=13677 RepID=A0AAV1PCY3_SCOSC